MNHAPRRGTKRNPFEEGESVRLRIDYDSKLTKGTEGVVVDVDDTPSYLGGNSYIQYMVAFNEATIRGLYAKYLESVESILL